jgi:hypothetical protein
MNQKELNVFARFFVPSFQPGQYEDMLSIKRRNPTYFEIVNTFHNKFKRDNCIQVIP